MKRGLTVGCVLMIALLAGCDPEALVVWAPNGQKAAVLGKQGLYLSDGEGTLSKLLIPGAVKAAWFADSQRLLAVVGQENVKWNDLEPYIGDIGRKKAAATADRLKREFLKHEGELDSLLERLSREAPFEDLAAGFLYLREEDQGELLRKHGEHWKKLLAQELTMSVLKVYEVNEKEARGDQVVAVSFGRVRDVRISPVGSAVAFLSESPAHGVCDLWIVRMGSDRTTTRVAEMVGWSVDWTADARSLVYARASGGSVNADGAQQLGWLRRLEVCDENGELKRPLPLDGVRPALADGKQGDVQNDAEALAQVKFSPLTRVRCLRDGQILFSSVEVTLPVKTGEEDKPHSLFVLDPAPDGVVGPAVPRKMQEHIGNFAHLFEISPAQTKIAVPGTGNRMTVLNLANGVVLEARPAQGSATSWTIPSWRNDEEVCYGVLTERVRAENEASKRERAGEMMVWSEGAGERKLSTTWGDEVVERLRVNQ